MQCEEFLFEQEALYSGCEISASVGDLTLLSLHCRHCCCCCCCRCRCCRCRCRCRCCCRRCGCGRGGGCGGGCGCGCGWGGRHRGGDGGGRCPRGCRRRRRGHGRGGGCCLLLHLETRDMQFLPCQKQNHAGVAGVAAPSLAEQARVSTLWKATKIVQACYLHTCVTGPKGIPPQRSRNKTCVVYIGWLNIAKAPQSLGILCKEDYI